MAIVSIRRRSTLDATDVLAPERYDPRREITGSKTRAVPLGEVARLTREVVQPSGSVGRCLVLDTSDAREGVVVSRKGRLTGSQIGSAKKVIRAGDVIISRLRPYLRQVAFVDDRIPNAEGAVLLCSTEFFVLRRLDEQSVAFLVPFLLTHQVQSVLAAAQEGGHHPRVNESTLLTLPVPVSLVNRREVVSKAVEQSVGQYREAERRIDILVADMENVF